MRVVTPSEAAPRYVELSERYNAPEDLGRIYAALADVYCQNGLPDPQSAVEYAEAALEYPLEPLMRMEVYMDLGGAMFKLKRERVEPEDGGPPCEDIVPYLRALRVALEEEVPDALPEIPRPLSITGFVPESDPIHEENERRKAAWQSRETTKKLMDMRQMVERKIFLNYLRPPCENEDFRELAEEILQDDRAVGRLMARYAIAKEEFEGRPIEGPSVLYPTMPPEGREKAGLGPICK
ncbi:MAG: hypothetical protein KF886_17745 [Candidatus Hydrogenedentes bacterium]|nr:hypothetical protein [Candidatus Hydrogenedentota bacterium]